MLVNVVTGTTSGDVGSVYRLTTEDWKKLKYKYKEIAEEHLQTCQYKEANIYVKQKQFWEGEK